MRSWRAPSRNISGHSGVGFDGMSSINVSDNGFAAGAVINGNIRDEIGLTTTLAPWDLCPRQYGYWKSLESDFH